jgi:TonB-dependent receptor
MSRPSNRRPLPFQRDRGAARDHGAPGRSSDIVRGAVLAGVLLAAPGSLLAGELTGRVADASGDYALTGAEVVLEGTGRRAITTAGGTFRFPDLSPGEYRIRVAYPGTTTFTATVTVPEQGLQSFDVRMKPAARYTESMVVIGQHASQAGAISMQRGADTVASFLTRDAIGQFPDQNVSEAVRRLPGVSVQNDQGEGRFIVVRGLDPNLNSASLNGVRITAPESDIRAVALDVVPSELVESIKVEKSRTPEMDGDAIGGSIDIRTTSALERREPFLSLTGAGSYNDLMGDWSPKIGLDGSIMVNERFGVSVGLSYFDRQLGSDNIEAEDWTDADDIVYAESIEFRDYDVQRTRIGATLGLDYLLTDTTTLFLRGVYSSFEDQEYRSRMTVDFGDAAPVSGEGSSARFELGEGEELSVERDIKDRNETQEILSLLLGGETFVDAWTFRYETSWTRSEEDESDTFDPTTFERTFEAGELQLEQIANRSDQPRIVVDSAFIDDFTDAATYEFDSTEAVDGLATDEEYGLRLDVARELTLGEFQTELKAGVRGRWREKSYDLRLDVYDGYEGAEDLLLSDVAGSIDYDLGSIDPVPSASAVRRELGDLSLFELNPVDTLFESAAPRFEVQEDVLAGYLQARLDRDRLRTVFGVRVESTENEMTGNRVDLIEEGGAFLGVPLEEDTVFVRSVEYSKSDLQWLPSANLRFDLNDAVVLRTALYRSLFRPNIADIAPRFTVEQNDEDEREGEFGNPDLDPYTAWNVDAGAEWYFADNSMLQAGVFYKKIDDFIVRSVVEETTFSGIFVNEGIIPVNAEEAEVLGLELGYQHALTNLPAPWDGLLLSANYTYVDSEGDFGARTIALPGTSEHVANLALGYEKGPVSLRLAWGYRDEYLLEVSEDGESDYVVSDYDSLDFSAKYQATERIQLFLEAINITDEPYVVYIRTLGFGDRLGQYEEYSFTLNVGFKATL